MNRIVKSAALASAFALASCGGGTDTAQGDTAAASGTSASADSRYEQIGAIEATVNGEAMTFPVFYDTEKDRSFVDERESGNIRSVNVMGATVGEDGKPGSPRMQVLAQLGSYGMKNITINDGSMMHPLESAGMQTDVTFDEDGSNGVYSGSFSGTLTRTDAEEMDGTEEVIFEGPVEVSGTFRVEKRGE